MKQPRGKRAEKTLQVMADGRINRREIHCLAPAGTVYNDASLKGGSFTNKSSSTGQQERTPGWLAASHFI